jgi:hypothetical protein
MAFQLQLHAYSVFINHPTTVNLTMSEYDEFARLQAQGHLLKGIPKATLWTTFSRKKVYKSPVFSRADRPGTEEGAPRHQKRALDQYFYIFDRFVMDFGAIFDRCWSYFIRKSEFVYMFLNHRQRSKQTGRQTDRYRHTDGQTDRYRQTNRQTSRQTDRQTYNQTCYSILQPLLANQRKSQ